MKPVSVTCDPGSSANTRSRSGTHSTYSQTITQIRRLARRCHDSDRALAAKRPDSRKNNGMRIGPSMKFTSSQMPVE